MPIGDPGLLDLPDLPLPERLARLEKLVQSIPRESLPLTEIQTYIEENAVLDQRHNLIPYPGGDWVVPTLGINWSDYGGEAVAYRKNSLGVVQFRGTVQRDTAGYTFPSTLLTLSAGYRPATEQRFICQGNDGNVGGKYFGAMVNVTTAGVLSLIAGTRLEDDTANSGAVNSFVSLSQIAFYPEQ